MQYKIVFLTFNNMTEVMIWFFTGSLIIDIGTVLQMLTFTFYEEYLVYHLLAFQLQTGSLSFDFDSITIQMSLNSPVSQKSW